VREALAELDAPLDGGAATGLGAAAWQWHALQCACALRRLLAPPAPAAGRAARRAPAPRARRARPPPPRRGPPPPPGWAAALERAELALLQRHLLAELRRAPARGAPAVLPYAYIPGRVCSAGRAGGACISRAFGECLARRGLKQRAQRDGWRPLVRERGGRRCSAAARLG